MNRDQAIPKIKKCLALAKSANSHEAAAAMRQAQKLMAEHQINDQDITLSDVAEKSAKAQAASITNWELSLAQCVARAFGCSTFTGGQWKYTACSTLRRKYNYVFVGTGSASEVAGYAFQVLSRQCAAARIAHVRSQPKNCTQATKTARGDMFALGWVYGMSALLKTFAGTEKNQGVIDQYLSAKYPAMKTSTMKDKLKGKNINHNDHYVGMQAGRSAQLHHGVGGLKKREMLA